MQTDKKLSYEQSCILEAKYIAKDFEQFLFWIYYYVYYFLTPKNNIQIGNNTLTVTGVHKSI